MRKGFFNNPEIPLLGKYNGIGFIPSFTSIAPIIDPDAQAYITAANITNPSVINDINTFFLYLKFNNLYSKLLKMHLFITDSLISATQVNQFKWNAINPLNTNAAYYLTPFNNPTTSQAGTTGNGTTQYWETYFNYGSIPNNAGLMVNFLGTTLGSVGCSDVVTGPGLRTSQVSINNGANTTVCMATQFTTNRNIRNATGMAAVNRIGNIQDFFYQSLLNNTLNVSPNGQPLTYSENILKRNAATPLYGTNGVNFVATYQNYTSAQVILLMQGANILQGMIETSLGLTPGSRKRY